MCRDCGDDFHSWSEDQAALKKKRETAKQQKIMLRLEKPSEEKPNADATALSDTQQ